MAKTQTTKKVSRSTKTAPVQEKDSLYLLKLLLYIFVGAQWLRVAHDGAVIPIPLGLIAGLTLAMHENFQIDRKIEFAVLLVAALLGFVTQFGMYITY